MQRFNKQIDCFTEFKKQRKMKKLVLMFVAIAAISFASCGNNAKPAANADSTQTDTTMSDATQSDSTAAVADTTAADSAK